MGDRSEWRGPCECYGASESLQPLRPAYRCFGEYAYEAAEAQLASTQVQEVSQSILDNTDKMSQFTDLMSQIVGKAIEENNQALSQNISEEVGKQVIKEMNYLMREREEIEEERFRKLDAAIRGSFKKKDEGKKIWKKKKPSQP